MKCQKCFAECDDRARFCGICGTALHKPAQGPSVWTPQQYRCPSCGTLFTASATESSTVSCPGCYRHLSVGTTPAPKPPPTPVMQPAPQQVTILPPPKLVQPPAPKPPPDLIVDEPPLEKYKCPTCTRNFAVKLATKPSTTNCPYCQTLILIQ